MSVNFSYVIQNQFRQLLICFENSSNSHKQNGIVTYRNNPRDITTGCKLGENRQKLVYTILSNYVIYIALLIVNVRPDKRRSDLTHTASRWYIIKKDAVIGQFVLENRKITERTEANQYYISCLTHTRQVQFTCI